MTMRLRGIFKQHPYTTCFIDLHSGVVKKVVNKNLNNLPVIVSLHMFDPKLVALATPFHSSSVCTL